MTAAMYYILSYLTRSDIVASVRGAGYLQSLMYLGALVVALFAAVLLLYANSFVMKRRRRELGLYNILGLEKRHIAHLMGGRRSTAPPRPSWEAWRRGCC